MTDEKPTALGKFQIEAEIDRGGFGTVFRAVDTVLDLLNWVGAHDMAGNVWVWVKGWHERGGSVFFIFEERSAHSNVSAPDHSSEDVGFRCVVQPG